MFSRADYGFITNSKTRVNGVQIAPYKTWSNIIHRCYNKNSPAYKHYGAIGVYICEEWKLFSNFKRWYDENYVEGFHIDKDISGLGYYGPEACVFISESNNTLECNSRRDYSTTTGKLNPNSKEKSYFETTPVRRCNFKTTCKKQGWEFESFKETESGMYIGRNGYKDKTYTYREAK